MEKARVKSGILDHHRVMGSHRYKDVECGRHIHPSYEAILVYSGVLQMEIGGNTYDIPAGYGTLVSTFEPHSFRSVEHNTCRVINFSKEFVEFFFGYMKNTTIKKHMFRLSRPTMELADDVFHTDGGFTDTVEISAVLASLALDVQRGCEFEVRAKIYDSAVYRVLEYVDEHFREGISLESVSRAVGLHPVSVSRLVSTQTRVTFNEYLAYVRCTYAARLIRAGNSTFSEIAYEAGFGSIRSFNRVFSSFYKITPSEYKKNLVG